VNSQGHVGISSSVAMWPELRRKYWRGPQYPASHQYIQVWPPRDAYVEARMGALAEPAPGMTF